MPVYDFQCECGLRFEQSVRFAERDKPFQCPSCGALASRLMPKTVNGVFVQEVTGPVPQNTGLSAYDAHVDRVIGKSSKQGWEVQEQRQKDKAEVVRANPGVSPHGLSQNPDGSWRPLTKEERGVQQRVQIINGKALNSLSARKHKKVRGD